MSGCEPVRFRLSDGVGARTPGAAGHLDATLDGVWAQLTPDSLATAGPGELLALGTELAPRLAAALPHPGAGHTRELWEAMATLAAADLTVARVVEPHLDATAILTQAGVPAERWPAGLLGVYAAEGPGMRMTAERHTDQTWSVTGAKPWCSLASQVGGFLVTAWVDERQRGLFLVDADAVQPRPSSGSAWVARGLAAVTSTALGLNAAPAIPVGGPQWYLARPGFAWGGMGVAAIWHGGAVGVARRVWAQATAREPDQVALMHLGALDAALHRSASVLAAAADAVDEGRCEGAHAARVGALVRQTVRVAAEEVLGRADHALGPAPLAMEETHARRVADLHLYVRQEHAERDQATLGAALVRAGESPW